MKIGIGYDVHRLAENKKLVVGGVTIPYEKGFVAHSDGDVLIHAIIDSILGALGKRDIGTLFPDSDDKYKNIKSMTLLIRVFNIMLEEGYLIGNIDSIIIAEAPKFSPYIEEMRENIANCLDCDKRLVNVKATTEEGLGFTGKGQGIGAKAVCILKEIKGKS